MATRDRVRVTKLSEFFSIDYSTFVYEPKNNNMDFLRKHFSKFISPVVPLVAIALYLAFTKPICMGIRKFFGQPEKESSATWKANLKLFAFFHSVALAVYSGWTFYHTYDIVMSATAEIQAHPANAGITWFAAFMQANCDVSGHVWDKLDLGAWVFHFYLSKFYEFIDTAIVYLKGEKPIFLQTFHHAGVLVIMWSFVASQNNAMGVCFTVLNSFIHTVMYTYYALTAVGIKLTFIKPVITSLQLTQFITGIAYSTPSYFMETCHTEATWWTQLYANVYTVILVILFAQFSLKNYFKPSKQLGRELSTSFNQSTDSLDDVGALAKPKSGEGKKTN
jgi:hypothetical protein